MVTAAASAPRTQRFERKREAILDAAARLFNRDSVKGATLTDVAQSVGLITNSITYYYHRKEDLASACYRRTIDVLAGLARTASQQKSLPDRLAHFIGGWYRLQRDIALHAHPELVNFNEIRTLASTHSGAVFAAYSDMFRSVRGLLGSPTQTGLSKMELNARGHLLLSIAMWVRILVRRYEPDDYELVARRVCDIVLNGLAGPGVPWTDAAAALPVAPGNHSSDIRQAAREGSPQDFLRAATALINEEGYHGASVDRISARLNVTKGSFYHHHDNKDDLVAACFEHTFAMIRLASDCANAATGSGWNRLSMASGMLVRHQLSAQGPLLRITACSALPPELRHNTLHTLNCLTEKFGAFVVDGIIDGSIRPLDPAVAAQLVSAMINAAAELPMWAAGIDEELAVPLFARPLFLGIGCAGIGQTDDSAVQVSRAWPPSP